MPFIRKPGWLAIAIRGSMISAFFILLIACSNTVRVEHIEVFTTELSEKNEDGFYEETGYKKVNSITAHAENKNYIKTEIKMIEDFYDLAGNYIKSEITHTKFSKSHIMMTEDGDNQNKELQEPSTIMIPDEDIKQFRSGDLTDDEKKQVKQHVLSFMDRF